MPKCPGCGKSLSFSKSFSLGGKVNVSCDSCGIKLTVGAVQRAFNFTLGIVGPIAGALLGSNLYYDPSNSVLWLLLLLSAAVCATPIFWVKVIQKI